MSLHTIISKKGNGKTIKDIEKKFGKGFFLCNANDDDPIVDEVTFVYDEQDNTLGVFVEEMESFINLSIPEKYVSYRSIYEYLRTPKATKLMLKVFNFVTKK